MKATTKLFTLGAAAAATYGAIRLLRAQKPSEVDARFDSTDVRAVADASDVGDATEVGEPMIITEEVVVITDVGPYEVDLELFPANDRSSRR